MPVPCFAILPEDWIALTRVGRIYRKIRCPVSMPGPSKSHRHLAQTVFAYRFYLGDLIFKGIRSEGSYLDGLTNLQTRTSFCHLHRFLQAPCLNHKETGNCFLQFQHVSTH
jgi:hypothetical protein